MTALTITEVFLHHLRCYAELGWKCVITHAPVPNPKHQRYENPRHRWIPDDEYADDEGADDEGADDEGADDAGLRMMCSCGDRDCSIPDLQVCTCGDVGCPERQVICTCMAGPECSNPGKHPVYKRETFPPTSAYGALREAFLRTRAVIRAIPNIQLCPDVNTFAVLDIDSRHGGDQALAALEAKYGPLPRTPSVYGVKNPGERLERKHVYLAGDPRLIDCELGPGLEIIAGPKYAVAPPSLHWSSTRNRWGEVKPWEALAPWPQWVFTELAKTPAPKYVKKDLSWLEGATKSSYALAIDAYDEDCAEDWRKYNGRCPICGHKGCFGPLPDNPNRWKCFSANHPGRSTGGAAELHAFRARLNIKLFLEREGYDGISRPKRKTPSLAEPRA